jgi:hypothetical protein
MYMLSMTYVKLKRRRRHPNPVSSPSVSAPATALSHPSEYDDSRAAHSYATSSWAPFSRQESSDQVTVEDFLSWSATAPHSRKKRRRFVNLSDKPEDILHQAKILEECSDFYAGHVRKRRRGLPQLPNSDDEFHPSDEESNRVFISRKLRSSTGRKKPLSSRLLYAAMFSHVDIDVKHLPAASGDKIPLKFGKKSSLTPPSVLNPEKLRVVDPRKARFQSPIFRKSSDLKCQTKRVVTSWAIPLSVHQETTAQKSNPARRAHSTVPLTFTTVLKQHRRISASYR